jgi:SOS-response transcriptional repressor LexA
MKRLWIEKRLQSLGKKKSGLADAMGLPPARVTEILKGDRDIAVSELGVLASYLQMHVKDLISALTRNDQRLSFDQPLLEVRGRVQAGDWREAVEWPPNERYQVEMATPERFKDRQVFGLVVGGDSMDEVYPPGAVLMCVPLEAYGMPLKTGNRVIVQRQRKNGDYEATVKEYVEDGDMRWLIARSKNPIHRAPIVINGADTDSAQILAVVVASYKDESLE